MPRKTRKKPLGNFESPFDEELEELDTPSDSIDSIVIEESLEKEAPSSSEDRDINIPNELNNTISSSQEEAIETEIEVIENLKAEDSTPSNLYRTADKFGINKVKQSSGKELIARTFKYSEETISRVESLVYKDQRRSKKIPGTKGFISDFMENAIWQHLYQLGLATEEEVEMHLKDYSKYPLNFGNIPDEK
ncbi:TPA: hypothetical protein ACQK1M_002030 [Enterococcus hirae]|uniref:hypothetical protein n=1 Tax=Enterococcus hirae TaxID=1354 RepID=UPI001A96B288|nr:hypothetical protein [Enterococcus hirae]MBO1117003.1 hypothetical protein [Enterococcus hirae]